MDEDPLDRWVEAMPDAYTAHSARGEHRNAVAWTRRRETLAGDATSEELASMREAYELAAGDLRRAIALEPRHLVPYGSLVGILNATDRGAEAREVLERSLEIEPRTYSLRVRYMHILKPRWGGSYEEMEALARDAQSHAAGYPKLRRLLGFTDAERGTVARKEGDHETAVRAYSKALAFHQAERWVRNRARSYAKLGEHRHAADDYTAYIRSFGGDSTLYRRRGIELRELGFYPEALRDFDRAVRLKPSSHRAHAQRAWILNEMNRHFEAVTAYERAVELDPESTWALNGLGKLLTRKLGRLAEGARYLERVTELEPANARAWLAYADVLVDLDSPEAGSVLARYLEVAEPADPTERESIDAAREYLEERGLPVPAPR